MAGRGPRKSGSAATRPSTGSSPASPQARGVVAARSRPVLEWLSRLPPLVIPVAVLVLMLVGVTAPLLVALPALAIVTCFVGWLAYLSWPVLTSGGRLLRILMICLVVGVGVSRVAGGL
jgi:hypothetical protein